MDAAQILLVGGGAFLAGGMNAIAGGGTFFSFPALLAAGVPPVMANASNTVAMWPASLSSAWAYRREVSRHPRWTLLLVLVSLVGGISGSLLLLATSNAAFSRLVPWLLLVATALFALAPQLRAWSGHQGTAPAAWKAALGMLAVAAYGGYFNGGLGILLLALLGLLGQTQLNAMNGMKNLVSALLTAIAVGIYAAGGIVQWRLALLMMVAATLGGYGGARVARRLPATVLRWGIVATGLVMAGLFFARQ